MSAAQTWFDRLMVRLRSRYGYTGWAGCRVLVIGLRYSALMPMRAITVLTRLRPIVWPSPRNKSRSILAPANG
jgi:hypothetical protein